MRLVNETSYRTSDLRRFLLAGHAAHGADTAKTIRVTWSRHGKHWGCATYSGSSMLLTIPKGGLNMAKLALLFEHELAHNLGLRHGDMDAETRWGVHRHPLRLPAWAAGLELREKEAAPKRDPVAEREAHARRMLERWDRRLRLAKAKRARWALRVRYYDRKAAASPREE